MARFGTSARWLVTLGSLFSLTACADIRAQAPSDSKCFAPDKNLDTAYEQGAVGCDCVVGDQEQCIDGVALVCERGQWHAVEDGPCWPDSGLGEACGNGFCSQYGKCVTFPDGRQDCVSTLIDSGVPSSEAGSAEAATELTTQCGGEVCSQYAYCTPYTSSGVECRAKLNSGDGCSEPDVCMSGRCEAGRCQGDGRTSCTGTWDCPEGVAEAICKSRDCHVCVQSVDEVGRPELWAAIEPASCPCPLARSTPPVSTGAGAVR